MTITTRFNEGDKAFTLNTATLKVKEFEVERVSTYTTNGKTSVTLYAKNEPFGTNGYEEDKCFASEAELLNFITSKDDAETV